MLNKEIPFLRIGFPICLGIIAGLFIKPGCLFLVASLIIIITGFAISLLFNKGLENHLFGFPMTFGFFMCGFLLYTIEKKQLSDLEPVTGDYLCSISEYPEEKENTYRVIARLCARITGNGEIPLKGSLMIYFRKDSLITSLLPGDLLKIRCIPKPVVNRGNPYEFDYRFYMENHGIKYYSIAGANAVTGHSLPSHRKLKYRALIIREKIIEMYKERGITDDRLALVAAITLGQKNMLDQDQKQIFIKAGVMHIMAVSGLHAVILSLFIFNLLFFMKRKFNSIRIIITVLLLWSFAFVTGLTPSVLRATLMFSFLQAGKLMKRNVNSINSVLASAVILLIIHPSVLFDAGFLLSYSAVIFIICFYEDFYLKLSFKTWITDKIWQSAAITIVAQAGTLPLTITLFNRFPTWFILTNIIIVPLSSFLIIIGCLVPLTFPVRFISQPLASVLSYLTGLTETLTEKAAALPFSTIENIGMVTIESMLLFLFIFLFILFILNRRTFPLRYPLYAFLLFTSAGTIRSIADRASGELIVYNTPGSEAIGLRTGKILNLYCDNTIIPPEVLRHCAARGLKLNPNIINKKYNYIISGKSKILISSFLSDMLIRKTEPDHIIITSPNPLIKKQLHFSRPVNSIVITPSVFSYFNISEKLKNANIDTIHYVKKSGAFRMRL